MPEELLPQVYTLCIKRFGEIILPKETEIKILWEVGF
jgi:hypothetical protein